MPSSVDLKELVEVGKDWVGKVSQPKKSWETVGVEDGTPPKTNGWNPKNWWFGLIFLLFPGGVFRFQPLVFGGCILMKHRERYGKMNLHQMSFCRKMLYFI